MNFNLQDYTAEIDWHKMQTKLIAFT